MTQVSLVGTRLANPGTEFVYQGPSAACEGCPYRSQCLNLAEGTRYEVTDVRENTQVLDCAVHDTGVRAVEVEPASIPAAVPSKSAYAGSKSTPAGPCVHSDCPTHPLSDPPGADSDEEYQIQEVVGEPPEGVCQLDRDLTAVVLAPEE